jgi:[protein-PII] uridylyltransferase
MSMVESGLTQTLEKQAPLPSPSRGRVSRRVKSFPVTPRVTLNPDEQGQKWLLSISASDRIGLLYSVARVLAQHGIYLHLAKISTLGERVEDTFLISGPALQHNRYRLGLDRGGVLIALVGERLQNGRRKAEIIKTGKRCVCSFGGGGGVQLWHSSE